MAETQAKNLDLFLISSRRIDDHKNFVLKQSIDSLIVELAEQETDEPNYTRTIISVTEIIRNYALVLIGALSGYFPKTLTENLIEQVTRFLEIGPITEFYSLKRKLFIGDGILAYIIGVNNNDVKPFFLLLEGEEDIEEDQDFFNEFLVLYYEFKKDENIKAFLKIFDFYDSLESQAIIERMLKAFQSHSEIEKAFLDTEPNAIVGALNFLQFVSELKSLIDQAFFAPVLQSSMWHFYGYYFEENGNFLVDFFSTVFDHLSSILDESEELGTFISKLNLYYKELLIGKDDIMQFVEEARSDLVSICDVKYGKPLTNAVETIFEKYGVYETE
jgi:hypothetical protein